MKMNSLNFLIKTLCVTSIFSSVVINNNSYAMNINSDIANIGYWYGDDDIRGVIANRLGDRVYIAPAVPNSSALINDVAAAALNEARAGKPALIPINLNNNHWTCILIDLTKYLFYYFDPLGLVNELALVDLYFDLYGCLQISNVF